MCAKGSLRVAHRADFFRLLSHTLERARRDERAAFALGERADFLIPTSTRMALQIMGHCGLDDRAPSEGERTVLDLARRLVRRRAGELYRRPYEVLHRAFLRWSALPA